MHGSMQLNNGSKYPAQQGILQPTAGAIVNLDQMSELRAWRVLAYFCSELAGSS